MSRAKIRAAAMARIEQFVKRDDAALAAIVREIVAETVEKLAEFRANEKQAQQAREPKPPELPDRLRE